MLRAVARVCMLEVDADHPELAGGEERGEAGQHDHGELDGVASRLRLAGASQDDRPGVAGLLQGEHGA